MDDTIQIPGYIVERNIGSGAMATVYLAIQKALERRVALKLMASSLSTDSTFRERFVKEGRIIAQLNHPNIVTIFDIGLAGSNYYMAMEYLEGDTLKERMKEPLPPDQAVAILIRIASALGYAHKRNFVHRDVKPGNILFREDGTPVLTDFGIAKALGDSTQMTQAGLTIGTPSYMSPEQALGKPVDARCDLYALGVVFFEMLTGTKPYRAEDSFAIALMHINDPIPRLPEQLSRFQPIIDKLMAKSPDDRFASAEALIEALQPFRPGNMTHAIRASVQAAGPKAESEPVSTGQAAVAPGTGRGGWLLWLGTGAATLGLLGYFMITDVIPLPFRTTPSVLEEDWFGVETRNGPPLSEAQQQQIRQMLEIAQLNLETWRLVDPPVSNAAYVYHQILALDPDNTEARDGLRQIAETYLEQARRSLDESADPEVTLNQVEAGLVAAPRHPELLELKRRLASS
jgi:serine/threonine-protein kinase PpkA